MKKSELNLFLSGNLENIMSTNRLNFSAAVYTFIKLWEDFKLVYQMEQKRTFTFYTQEFVTSARAFTDELLCRIKEKGIQVLFVTLHVGLGTFRPVVVENILEHEMHSEFYSLTKESADKLNQIKKNGKKIIAVGTTTTRTLETIMTKYNEFKECSGNTNIFIYPGYEFQAIDALITNFHLPKSTLVMLVSAFSKKEYIINAYMEAQKNNYRFFSFGDAMLIKGGKNE